MLYIWKNTQTGEVSPTRPNRVRLDDGTTRTNDAITDEMLIDAGWVVETVADDYFQANVEVQS